MSLSERVAIETRIQTEAGSVLVHMMERTLRMPKVFAPAKRRMTETGMTMNSRKNVARTLAACLAAAWVTGCQQGAVPADGKQAESKSSTSTETHAQVESDTKAVESDTKVVESDTKANVQPEVKAVPKPESVTLPAGTAITGTLQSTIATDKVQVGEPVSLRVTQDVRSAGVVVVPAGSTVRGTVTHAQAAGRMKGAAELTIRFTEVLLASGASYPVTCEAFRVVSRGDGRESAAEIGGGAAVGGVLGGVIGGKDDVLKGAAIGAAVGTGVAVATKGDQIVLPAGRTIAVKLVSPVVVGVTS